MTTVLASRSPRLPRIVVLLCLAVVLALMGWIVAQVKKDHRNALARARSYLARGQPKLALQVVAGMPADGPDAAEGLTLAAQVFVMRGKLAEARRALERSLTIKPDQPEAAKILAAIYLAGGEAVRGLAMLQEAARLEPGDFRPWYAMGRVYLDHLANFHAAIEAYSQALRRSPPAAEAREAQLGRIRALLAAKQAERAATDLDELRRQTTDDPQVLALAAQQARDLGRLDEARELSNRALTRDPDNLDALLVRARIHVQSRRPKPALADLEHAVQVKPDDLAALQLLAQVQKNLGRTQDAAATQKRADRSRDRRTLLDRLAKAIDARPDDPEPRWRMGQAALEADMDILAYQSFQAALDLDPNSQPARAGLATLRSRKGFDPASLGRPQGPVSGKSLVQGR